MSATGKDFKCLICHAAIPHAHMGIDACRACGVFYRRSLNLKYVLLCTCGENPSTNKGKITSCRKCRFDRFKEIFEKANSGGIACTKNDQPICGKNEDDPSISEDQCADEPSPSFIDHNSSFNCDNSESETPLLDKMKHAYCMFCQVRKTGEMSALHHQSMHAQVRNDEMILRPAKYSEATPYSQIFFIGLTDFAKSAFPEYCKMSSDDRHRLVQSNFRLIYSLDRTYRAYINFPNDDTVMASYSTYMNEGTVREYFDDCPPEVNKEDAIEHFRNDMKSIAVRAKLEFSKVKPTIDEFMVLFGLSLWNDYTASLSPQMTSIISANREAMLMELKTVYRRRGVTEYAPRMGELLCLLANEERLVDLLAVHMEMNRLMNLFKDVQIQ